MSIFKIHNIKNPITETFKHDLMNKSLVILLLNLFVLNSLTAQNLPDYNQRQEELLNKMNEGVAIIFASNKRGELNNNYFYLTGKKELSEALILCTACNNKSMLISLQDNELRKKLTAYLSSSEQLWVSFDDLEKVNQFRNFLSTRKEFKNVDYLLYQLREIKDHYEQKSIKKAVDITTESYSKILKSLKPGLTEQEVIDAFVQHQLDFGAQSTSFIQAGSGSNGTQIHAEPTNKIIEDGDLVVFDVGAWYDNYTSDISRTYPANGKFSKAQKDIYQLVLNAQKAGIEKMVAGAIMLNVQQTVENRLLDGLFSLGLITDINCPWQRKLFLVHGYYHYIGLDIHDCYPFMSKETASKAYEPGMIMTMEPGLYFPTDLLDKRPSGANSPSEEEWNHFIKETKKNFERYANMGVRIEDDILITILGNEVLSKMVPKEIEEIEEMMK